MLREVGQSRIRTNAQTVAVLPFACYQPNKTINNPTGVQPNGGRQAFVDVCVLCAVREGSSLRTFFCSETARTNAWGDTWEERYKTGSLYALSHTVLQR